MIYLTQLQFHVRHDVLQLYVHRHHEESGLFLVYHPFAFVYQGCNVLTFLIQMHQFLFLDGERWFILVSIVNVALQVNHIPQRRERDIPQYPLHIAQIAILTARIILAEIVVDSIVQVSDALLDTCHIDFLVHLQHILEKYQIYFLQFHKVGIFADDTISLQELNAFIPLTCQFTCQVIPKRQFLPVLE